MSISFRKEDAPSNTVFVVEGVTKLGSNYFYFIAVKENNDIICHEN